MKFIFFPQIAFISLVAVLPNICGEETSNFFPIRYKNCKSRFELIFVGITGCKDTDRCQFERGKDYSIQIGFKPDRQVETLKTSVWAHLGDSNGAMTRYHIENENVCSGGNVTCPVEPANTYWYTLTVKILPEYPTVQLQVSLVVAEPEAERNEQGLPVNRDICIKFLAKVTGGEE